jgi:hypothetical protein
VLSTLSFLLSTTRECDASVRNLVPPKVSKLTNAEYQVEEHKLGFIEVTLEGGVKNLSVDPPVGLSVRTFRENNKLIIVFTGAPGKYVVKIVKVYEDYRIEFENIVVVITPRKGEPKPDPKPEPKPEPNPEPDTKPKPDQGEPNESWNAYKAVVKIETGVSMCSATAITQLDEDVTLVTAAHCVSRIGQKIRVTPRNNPAFDAYVVAIDRDADLSVLRGKSKNKLNTVGLAKAVLGERVWHCGFGIDKPGNIEKGHVVQLGRKQNVYYLNVSSGDSGGGIFNYKGEWLGAVCCTMSRGMPANVWAGNVDSLRPLLQTQDTTCLDCKKRLELQKKIIVYLASKYVVLWSIDRDVITNNETIVDFIYFTIPEGLLDELAIYSLNDPRKIEECVILLLDILGLGL